MIDYIFIEDLVHPHSVFSIQIKRVDGNIYATAVPLVLNLTFALGVVIEKYY